MYTQVEQRRTIAQFVGQTLADRYVTSHQFLARGHLAAKSDYVFATGQRASFYFINAAPQWQPFNAGNWNSLEQVCFSFYIQSYFRISKNIKQGISSSMISNQSCEDVAIVVPNYNLSQDVLHKNYLIIFFRISVLVFRLRITEPLFTRAPSG